MNYFIKTLLAIWWVLMLFTPICAAETIQIAAEEYPPHTSEVLKYNGLDCRIVTEAFALEDIKVEYSFFPGKRAFFMAQNGKVDGTLPWVWRKDRVKDFHYPDPVIAADMETFFHLKSFKFNWNPDKPDYNDIKGLKIGGVLGYNYGNMFNEAEESGLIHVERVETISQNFEKLLTGRIQLFLSYDKRGSFQLHKSFTQEQINLLTHTPQNTQPTEKFYLILSKKGSKGDYFLKAFNRGLKLLKESGKYDQFIQESDRGDYIIHTKKAEK